MSRAGAGHAGGGASSPGDTAHDAELVSSGGGLLAGRRVLVPVTAGRERSVVPRLEELGALVTTVELARIAPAADPAGVSSALDRLGTGEFAWLAVTSSHAVDALEAAAPGGLAAVVEKGRSASGGSGRSARAGSSRVAAVGPATARALAEVGVSADLVPAGERSARGLLAVWPEPDPDGGREVLLAQGDLAEPTLAAGLAERGWQPTAVVVYRNLSAAPLAEEVRADLGEGAFDAVLLTSGSVAERLLAQVSPAPGTAFVALGPRTAETVRALGVDVAATSTGPDPAALVDALTSAVTPAVGHVPSNATLQEPA